jgi:hypothetical protein
MICFFSSSFNWRSVTLIVVISFDHRRFITGPNVLVNLKGTTSQMPGGSDRHLFASYGDMPAQIPNDEICGGMAPNYPRPADG